MSFICGWAHVRPLERGQSERKEERARDGLEWIFVLNSTHNLSLLLRLEVLGLTNVVLVLFLDSLVSRCRRGKLAVVRGAALLEVDRAGEATLARGVARLGTLELREAHRTRRSR